MIIFTFTNVSGQQSDTVFGTAMSENNLLNLIWGTKPSTNKQQKKKLEKFIKRIKSF